MRKILEFLSPKRASLILFLFMIALVLPTRTQKVATSKVSWIVDRGLPFTFMVTSEYEGADGEGGFGQDMVIQDFRLWALTLDIVLWYLVSSVVVFLYQIMKRAPG